MNFWQILGIVASFTTIISLGLAIPLFRDWLKKKNEIKELRLEIQKSEKKLGEKITATGKKTTHDLEKKLREVFKEELRNVSLDSLPQTNDSNKTKLLDEGLKAIREYHHAEALAKFQEALPLASDDSERCAILNLIGVSQIKNGVTLDAEQTFLEMIRIAERAKLDKALSVAFGNIGPIYKTLGEPLKALKYLKKALKMDEKVGNLEGQSANLGNIGFICRALGEPHKALEYHQKALKINEKIGRIEGQAADLGNIGIVYLTLGEPHKALEYYEKALKIDEQTGRLEGQANQLGNIGIVYRTLGELHKALEYHEKALKINERIVSLEGQAIQLNNIAVIYFNLGNYKWALDCTQRAHEFFVKIGAKLEIEQTDYNIALARQALAEQGNPPSPP